jgi:hypothetical protein
MSDFGSFDSVFDDSEDDPLLSDDRESPSNRGSDGAPSSQYEEKTIYVSEEEGPPPELEEVNEALQNDWTIQDINLGYHKEQDSYGFVITLARIREPSLFDFAE